MLNNIKLYKNISYNGREEKTLYENIIYVHLQNIEHITTYEYTAKRATLINCARVRQYNVSQDQVKK